MFYIAQLPLDSILCSPAPEVKKSSIFILFFHFQGSDQRYASHQRTVRAVWQTKKTRAVELSGIVWGSAELQLLEATKQRIARSGLRWALAPPAGIGAPRNVADRRMSNKEHRD